MPRTVTIALVSPEGGPLGVLPPFDVAEPWWQETVEIGARLRERYGVDADVLRLLSAERPEPPGGAVTYLAQARAAIPAGLALRPVPPALLELTADHPRRAAHARPGGPARSLAWARGVVGPGTAVQVRTWNLSAIWRLETAGGTYWLKQVPAWLTAEPAVLTWLAEVTPDLVPALVAVGAEGLELLGHAAGEDLYGADVPTRLAIVAAAHRFQIAGLDHVPRLIEDGVPDRRGPALAAWIRSALAGYLEAAEAPSGAVELVAGLDERMAAVAACGVPDTLVHADAHPGNVRGAVGEGLAFLDWSECFLGHPGLDLLGLVGDLPPDEAAVVTAAWAGEWRDLVPGCDPVRAVELLRPVAALRAAAVYADFLEAIEPTERPYHVHDVAPMLARAVER